MRCVLLAALALPASAQIIEPDVSHYAAAYEALAVQEAASRLQEAAQAEIRLNRLLRAARQAAAE